MTHSDSGWEEFYELWLPRRAEHDAAIVVLDRFRIFAPECWILLEWGVYWPRRRAKTKAITTNRR